MRLSELEWVKLGDDYKAFAGTTTDGHKIAVYHWSPLDRLDGEYWVVVHKHNGDAGYYVAHKTDCLVELQAVLFTLGGNDEVR